MILKQDEIEFYRLVSWYVFLNHELYPVYLIVFSMSCNLSAVTDKVLAPQLTTFAINTYNMFSSAPEAIHQEHDDYWVSTANCD